MRGVDTNVLLRLVLVDDPEQGKVVQLLVRELVRANEPLFATSVVLCEFVWVLQRGYRLSRDQIADTLEKLLESEHLVPEHSDETREALIRYRAGRGDFADYLIGLVSRSAGCRDTVTFDRSLTAVEGFAVLR
jgi:predicted nucleic-acid-binding protein